MPTMMPRNKYFFLNNDFIFKKAFTLLLGTALTSLLQFIYIAILSRLLDKTDFGVIAVAQVVINFVLILSQGGIIQLVVQRRNINKDYLNTCNSFSLLLGVIFSILTFSFSGLLADFYGQTEIKKMLMLLAFFILMRSLLNISEGLVLRHMQFRIYVKNQFLSLCGFVFTTLLFATQDFGFYSIIFGYYAQIFITFFIYYKYYIPGLIVPNFDIIKNISFNGLGYTLISISNYSIEEMDNLVIGKFLGLKQLGIYERSFRIFSYSARFFNLIYDKIAFPYLSKRQKNIDYLQKNLFEVSKLLIILFTPFSLLLICFSKNIVLLLLGSKWVTEVTPVLQILLVGLNGRLLFKVFKNHLNTRNITFKTFPIYLFYLIALVSMIGIYRSDGLKYVASIVVFLNYLNIIVFLFFFAFFLKYSVKEVVILILFLLSSIVILIAFYIRFNYVTC